MSNYEPAPDLENIELIEVIETIDPDLAEQNQQDADELFDLKQRAKTTYDNLLSQDVEAIGRSGRQALEAQKTLLKGLFCDDL